MLHGARFVLGKVEEGSGGVGEWWRWAVEWERGGDGVGGKTERWCYSTFKKTWEMMGTVWTLGVLHSEFTLSSVDVLQGFSFFLQMGLTLILATLDGLDVGLLGDVIGEDDYDDDG
nr:hypothetical protein [Tanacetum cinerariifolium]